MFSFIQIFFSYLNECDIQKQAKKRDATSQQVLFPRQVKKHVMNCEQPQNNSFLDTKATVCK